MMQFKKDTLLSIVALFSLLSFTSCERLHVGIGYIKNNTQTNLAGANWGKVMTDSVLCSYKHFDNYIIPGLSQDLSIRPSKGEFSELPDTSIEYIYIFNLDSLNKYQKLKLCEGIVKRCLVKKIEIQLNKVKEPMDTVFINSSKPLH